MSENKPSAAALRAAQEIVVRYQVLTSDCGTWVGVAAPQLAAIIERHIAGESHVRFVINKTETDNATVSDPVTAWAKLHDAMTAMKAAADALDTALDHAIAAVKGMEPK